MTGNAIIENLEELPSGKYKVIQMVIRGDYRMFWSSHDRAHYQMLDDILDESGPISAGRGKYEVSGMGLCRCKVGVSSITRLWHLHFGGSSILLNYRINYDHLKAYVASLKPQGIAVERMDSSPGETFSNELAYGNVNLVLRQTRDHRGSKIDLR